MAEKERLVGMNWLKRFLQIDDPPAQPAKEKCAMHLVNIWQRKPVEFTDATVMARADTLARKSAYKIVNDPALSGDYIAIYGQEEYNTLKAGLERGIDNLVQSYVQGRCQGGVYVASEVVKQAALGPDEVWLDPPFCTRRGKRADVQAVPATNPGSAMTLSKAELRDLIEDAVAAAFAEYANLPQ